MAQGSSSKEVEYGLPAPVWPAQLIQPSRPPLLIYLDLAHWIGLAKARRGRGTSEYTALDEAIVRAVAIGRARVVLSGSLFREVSKIKDPKQRRALAEVMEAHTDFSYLAGVPDVMLLELSAVLDFETGTTGISFEPIDLIGTSALTAFGLVGGLQIFENGIDVTSKLVAGDPAWAERHARMQRLAERKLLAGPEDHELPELRADGYRPEEAEKTFEENAKFEAEWSRQIGPHRDAHVLRDMVAARFVAQELLEPINFDLAIRRIPLDQILPTPADGRRFAMSMPTSAVSISLRAQYHQNPSWNWTANDLYDVDALAVAVPYCDIVLTDAAARDGLVRRGLGVHFGTHLPRRPQDLTRLLSELG